MARIVFFGFGQLAQQIPALMPQHECIGIKRTALNASTQLNSNLDANLNHNLSPNLKIVLLDLNGPEQLIHNTLVDLGPIDAVVYSATPSARTEANYRQTYCAMPQKLIRVLKKLQHQPHWLHVSSTGVFHHNAGEWVHENTEPAPQSVFGKILRESELIIEHEYDHSSVLRFGGLYGQGKTHLMQSIQSGRRIQKEPWSYTNRIHRFDAARAIAFILENMLKDGAALKTKTTAYYHGVDHDPAPIHEVAEYLVKLHGLRQPEYFVAQKIERVESQNKRVGNHKLISMGFKLTYPTYRLGFS